MAGRWQREVPRESSSFGKNIFRLTKWPKTGGMLTTEVYGHELRGLLVWDMDILPRTDDLVIFLQETGLAVALYGSRAPPARRNPTAQALSLVGCASNVPIAHILRNVWAWRSRSGTIFLQDQTVFRAGKYEMGYILFGYHLFHPIGAICVACGGEHNLCSLENQDGDFERGRPLQGTSLFGQERRSANLAALLRAGRQQRELDRAIMAATGDDRLNPRGNKYFLSK